MRKKRTKHLLSKGFSSDMLFESLSQPMIFLWLTVGGLVGGFVFDLKNIFLSFFHKNKILSQILLFFAVFAALFLCFFLNLKTNYGEFRVFPIFAFALSFAIERFFAQNFLAKPLAKCYNKLKEKTNERRARKTKNQVESAPN